MMHLQCVPVNRTYFSYNFFFQQHLRTYSDVANVRQKKPKQPEGAGTECVLCTSACFTEHLSADPGEWSSVAKEGGGRGGVGLRTIVSPSTMRASEKASQQSLQQRPGTHGNRYGPVFGDGGVSGGAGGAEGREGGGE